jgi:hypothetical protein
MEGFGGFRPAAFRFLRDLERNNAKAWFEANRDVYEREVREPMRLLVETLDATLGSIAPEIVGDPKRSMFRIHRDVRFSKNKSPYKTNAGAWLYHRDAGRKWHRGRGRGAGLPISPPPASWPAACGCRAARAPAHPRNHRRQPSLCALTSTPGSGGADGLSEEAKPAGFLEFDRPSRGRVAGLSRSQRASIERAVTARLVDRLCRLQAAGAPGALAQSRSRLPAKAGVDMTRRRPAADDIARTLASTSPTPDEPRVSAASACAHLGTRPFCLLGPRGSGGRHFKPLAIRHAKIGRGACDADGDLAPGSRSAR